MRAFLPLTFPHLKNWPLQAGAVVTCRTQNPVPDANFHVTGIFWEKISANGSFVVG